MSRKVRVRFAPSPTGGLHLGGVRTVLYNYLFARHHGGDFVLRIEDTDQTRFVPGAEDYIFNCLEWCGLLPDESPRHPGEYGPYRQSERKAIYRRYAEQLIEQGNAYYAFDTPEELQAMRDRYRSDENHSPQYDKHIRMKMRNSFTLSESEIQALLDAGTPHVIRIKMPDNEQVSFQDMIRGEVSFDTELLDDKVLLKADGMPTYHLAVVVDDYLMKITHAFRGEEWLPSSPVHILLWRYLGWERHMPEWAHLPLIMGPRGKLSKRDGAKYGFPVFAMNWTDPNSNELIEGFREKGFLPEAFINFLALLGWNDGTDQEIYSLAELTERFSLERVHSAGAHFDYEKARWFNHEWIKRSEAASLLPAVKACLNASQIEITDESLLKHIIDLVKERCTLLTDFTEQSAFFFRRPETWDIAAIQPKWNEAKQLFFAEWLRALELQSGWDATALEKELKEMASVHGIKPGELMLPLRVMLVGGKFGPGVFDIAAILGREETMARIKAVLKQLA
jgi:glutamyl-tRNA synthetase